MAAGACRGSGESAPGGVGAAEWGRRARWGVEMSGQGGVKGWNVAARRCEGDKMWPPGEVQAKECGHQALRGRQNVAAGRGSGQGMWLGWRGGRAMCGLGSVGAAGCRYSKMLKWKMLVR